MKTQKRNLQERAYQHGYQAGLQGRHLDICPHTQDTMRNQWMAGWREGRLDNWGGFNAMSGAQKMALR